MSDQPEARISDLHTLDSKKREEAIERLVAVGEPAIAPLIRFLREYESRDYLIFLDSQCGLSISKETVLKAVQQALAGIGAPAIPSLIALMQDKNTKLREHVSKTLNLMGPPAVDALIDLMKPGDTHVRAVAASAMIGIRDDRVALVMKAAVNDPDVQVRAAAIAVLSEAPDEETPTLLRRVLAEAIAENGRMRRRKLMKLLALYTGIIGLFVLMILTGHWKGGIPFWGVNFIIQTSIGFVAFDATVGVRRNAVKALGKAASPRMAGAFVACLNDKSADIRNTASGALKELLPKLQASDRQFFALAEMDALLRALGGKDEALTVAILKALEQIGDDRAIPKVEALSKGARSATVRKVAMECLPFLKERAEETRQARTLLRASHSEAAVATGMLLRPATSSALSAPEELLRATNC